MSGGRDASGASRHDELSRLMARLHETRRRIAELTGGAVDDLPGLPGRDSPPGSGAKAMRRRAAADDRDAVEPATVLDALPAHIALLGRDGTIIAVNSSWRHFAEANGWKGGQAGVGENYLAVCGRVRGGDAREAEEAAAGIRAVLAGEVPSFSLEYPCHGPEQACWFRMVASPVEALPGGGAVVMHLDITKRKLAEEALGKTSRLLRIACRTARMGGWSVDLASRRVDWSEEVCAIHDMAPGTQTSVEEGIAFYAPEWRDRIREAFAGCARDGTPYDEELEIVTARGARKWVRTIGEPVRGEDGRITAVHGAFQDLSPIKEAEAALLLSERRFHQLAETLPQIVWTAEPDGTVDFVSSDFYRLTGLERVNVAARERLKALHPEDRERCMREWGDAVARGEDYRIEFRLRNAAGQDYRWHLVTAQPVRDSAGTIVKWYGTAVDIHDRRLAEQALAEAQRQNQMILVAAGDGIHVLDAEGRIIFENPAARRMLGFGRDEVIGQLGHALIHHHHADGRPYPVEDCAVHRTLTDGQTRLVAGEVFFRKDGSSFPIEYTCAPVIDETTGAITGAVVNFRDVTEKKRAEDLREMEARVLDMVSAGRPLAEILEEITRGTDRLLPGVMSSVLLLEEGGRLRHGAAPGLPEAYNAALDGLHIGPRVGSCGTAAYRGEPVIVTDIEVDPLWRDFRELARTHGLRACWSAPVQDAEGTVLATFAMYYHEPRAPEAGELEFVDHIAQFARVAIERTRQREALRMSEERFRIVNRATSDVLWDWDLVADAVWWNEGITSRFGIDPDSLRHGLDSWSRHIHADDRERVVAGIRAVIDDPASSHWADEYRFLCADGSAARIVDQGHVIRDTNGKPVRMVGSMVDVTAQRELEEKLQQAQRLDAMGRLTGGVAHDFNNLLMVILGNAELLVEQLAGDQELQSQAEMVVTAAERGAELTRRLLAFGRRQPLDPKPADVNRLLDGMDSLLRRTLGEDVELEIVRGGGLWQAMVDATQLESALLNLSINARDAMPAGGRLVIETANTHIDAYYAAHHPEVVPGEYIMLAVSDTGEGMDAEAIGRAFEPFFTTKEVGKGSGLGLSQVYGFITQSRGHVRLYSEPGLGTVVKLYLPRATTEADTAQQQVVEAAGPGTERILLVEDDALVRDHVAAQLADLGYRVTIARDGAEALAALRRGERFDLLFTDVVMPGGMSGRQLADEAQKLHADLPVLFTSGYTESAIIHHGRLDPGVHLLQKPYHREDLAAKLRKILDAPPGSGGGAD